MKNWKHFFTKAVSYLILTTGAVYILLPFIWMILTSVKPGNEVLMMPPGWLPSKIQWENYAEALQAVPFMTYLRNSVIVTVCVAICELATTILAAFAFAQLEFKGKNLIFMLLVATMMVPGELLLIPNFVTLAKLGWINSYKALIVPWTSSVFSIFLLRQQFAAIPSSYHKAAKIDGCSDLRYLLTVMVPMSRPTLFSVALLKIISSWNSYLWPLIATNEKSMRTLPVGLAYFSTESGTRYHVLMAFSLLIISPTVIIYFLTRKYIVHGVSKHCLKG